MTIFASILLFISFCIVFTQQDLSLRSLFNDSLKAYTNTTYNLKLIQSLKNNTHLFIIANGKSLDIYETPQLTIVNGNKVWRCQLKKNMQLCAIASSQIDITLSVQVQAVCIMDCNYSIFAYVDQQHQLQIGTQFILNLTSNSQGYLFNLNIPKNLIFSQVIVTAQILNIANVTEGFFMYAEINSKLNFSIPYKKEQFKDYAKSIWNAGMGMIFNKSDIKNGDNITIILVGPNKMRLLINCYSINENIRNITAIDSIKDFIKDRQQRVYILNLDQILHFTNQNLEINIIRYSGNYRSIISNESNFHYDFELQQYNTFNVHRFQYKIQILRQYFTQNLLYIKIISVTQCAYQIKVKQVSNYNFTFIKHNQLQFSRISQNQVDNYLYITQYENIESINANPIVQYRIYMRQFEGICNLFIKRCSTLESNNSLDCVFNQFKQLFGIVRSQEIFSHYHYNDKFKQISFEYNITQCPIRGGKYKCVFQFVVWGVHRNSAVQYSFSVQEQGKDIELKQSETKKIKLQKNQTKYLYFTLGSLINVKEIKFMLNTIYGDCALVSSNSKFHPYLYDNDQSNKILVSEGNIKYNKNQSTVFSKFYFLSLYGYEQSSVILSLQISRVTSQTMIQILQNIFYTFTIQSGGDLKKFFYIKLDQPENFYISISNHDSYSLDIALYPYQTNPNTKSVSWKPVYDMIQVDNINDTYSRNNDFVLVVQNKQNKTARFSLMYSTEASCVLYRVGQIIEVGLNQKITKCIFFIITKPEDFEVIINQNFFQIMNESIEIYSFISGFQVFFTGNKITLDGNQLKQDYCKSLDSNYKQNVYDCVLKLIFTSNSITKISILSQYTNDQVQLINGVSHRVEQVLHHKPKFLYSKLTNEDSIKIIVKRLGTQKFKIKAKIMQENKFAILQLPDAYLNNDTHIFESETDSFGVTMVLIKSEDLKSMSCKKCIVLISVSLQEKILDQLANFTIQVSQQIQQIKLGDNTFHFIQKDTQFQYIYKPTKKSLVSLHSMVLNCVNFNVFRLDSDHKFNLIYSNKTQIVLQVNNTVQTYGLVLYGIRSCNYHLRVSEPSFNFIELTESTFYQGIVNPNQSLFFLYYHHEDTNLEIVAFQDYGEILLSALQYDSSDSVHMTHSEDIKYQFQSESYKGNILINRNSDYFCYRCFYLVRVTSLTTSKFTLIVKIANLPIPLREDRTLRDEIQISQTITYTYRTDSHFRLQITNLYGDFNIFVKNNEQIFQKSVYKNIYIYQIPGSGRTIQDKASQYIITIIGFKSSAFLISLRKNENLVKLKYNNPSSLVLKKNRQSCGKFIAEGSQSSIFIVIQADKLANINFNFDCSFIGLQAKNTCKFNIVKNHSNDRNINYQLSPESELAEYIICAITNQIQRDISILISTNSVNQLSPISEYMFKTTQNHTVQYFSINNNKNNSYLFIEIYQCKGKINLTASQSLKALRNNQTNLIVNEIESSGHHIITMNNISEGQYFLKTVSQKDSLYLLKYNFYQVENPYEKLTIGDKGNILIDINQERVIFSFKKAKIEDIDILKIQNVDYFLMISKSKQQLLAYTQCNIDNEDPIFTKLLRFTNIFNIAQRQNHIKKTIENTPSNLNFTVQIKELTHFFANYSNLLYIQIICLIKYMPSNYYKPDYYKLNYAINTMPIPLQNHIQLAQSKFDYFIFWLILPTIIGIILIFLAGIYCIRKIRELRYQNNFVQQPQKKSEEETDTNESNKVIVTKNQNKLQPPIHIEP